MSKVNERSNPSEWIAEWDDSGQWYVNIDGFSVSGTALRGDSGKCIESDRAHLIAAAPDLLGALQDVMGLVDSGDLARGLKNEGHPDWGMRMIPLVMKLKRAQEAIRKATNRAEALPAKDDE